jgi:hypothetical protein
MSNADNVILTFPPRPVSQWERALLAEWFAATQREGLDVARAFVSERRGDDPKIIGKIAVVLRANREPSFLVYSPRETAFWVVTAAPAWNQIQRYRTLRAALNSVRPVLEMPEVPQNTETTSLESYLATSPVPAPAPLPSGTRASPLQRNAATVPGPRTSEPRPTERQISDRGPGTSVRVPSDDR